MKSLVLATANQGKAEELRELLRAAGLPAADIRTLADYPELPEVEETGATFLENAMLKARAAWLGTGLPALADDSGLEIDALQGAPGVFSARFAGEAQNDGANIKKVLSLLDGLPTAQRTARFQCALAWVGLPDLTDETSGKPELLLGKTALLREVLPEKRWQVDAFADDGKEKMGLLLCNGEYAVMGSIEGLISTEKQGTMGFGYDPIFYLPEYDLTMAQIPPMEKNMISHRARAFARMMPVLRAYVRMKN